MQKELRGLLMYLYVNMDKVKIKQEVFGLGKGETNEPREFCADGEAEAIGEDTKGEKEDCG